MSNLVVSMQKVGVSGLWVMELANTKLGYKSQRCGYECFIILFQL